MSFETRAQQPFESRDFRRALGRFPTGVTVITGRDPVTQSPVGITVSSFNSLSLDPPLVLWSIAEKSPSLGAFAVGGLHYIHVLSVEQAELARHFATPKENKFQGIPTRNQGSLAMPPQLSDCAVIFDCVTERLIQAGDHILVIAKVRSYEAFDADPLVFCKSEFLSPDLFKRIAG